MTRQAAVYCGEQYAGILEETGDPRGYRFTYDATYQGPAVSLTLPLQSEPFVSAGLFPFFAGLIPEGWYLDIVTRTIKVDPADTFGVLLATCSDCIGAVSLRETHNA